MIVYRGQKSTKVFFEETCVVQPCVATDRDNELAQLGVAVLVEGDGGRIWGLLMPRFLITSFRAMKLLEALDEIGNADLCRAWYSAKRNPHKTEQHYLDELLPRLPKGMRERVLGMVPPDVDDALCQLHAKDIDVSVWELQKEIELGLLQPTSLIEQLIREAEERRQALAEGKEVQEKPKRRRQRLSFFRR